MIKTMIVLGLSGYLLLGVLLFTAAISDWHKY